MPDGRESDDADARRNWPHSRTRPSRSGSALRRDPATAPVLRALEATKGAGPQLLAAPPDCTKPIPARAVSKAGPATIPKGTYEVRASVKDFERWGQYGPQWEKPIVWTIKTDGGRSVLTQQPAYGNVGALERHVHGRGDVPASTSSSPTETTRSDRSLELLRRQAELRAATSSTAGRGSLAAHPWEKVS